MKTLERFQKYPTKSQNNVCIIIIFGSCIFSIFLEPALKFLNLTYLKLIFKALKDKIIWMIIEFISKQVTLAQQPLKITNTKNTYTVSVISCAFGIWWILLLRQFCYGFSLSPGGHVSASVFIVAKVQMKTVLSIWQL